MGKGTIISGGEGGQYTVRLEWSEDRLASEASRLAARIAGYTAYIAELSDGKVKDRAELEKSSLERRLERVQEWQAENAADERTIWCADHTEDLTGEVGTIEVPGEPSTVLIQPGYGGNAAYDSARDGQLEKPEAGTPAGVFWNWALMPLWQKYMPTYRTGTITALNDNLADVSLDAAMSTQQGLDVNDRGVLSDVPIDYMTCDYIGFGVGDEVVVEFTGQSWDNPKVVGFKDNPVECSLPYCPTMATPTECSVSPVDIVDLEFEGVTNGSDAAGEWLVENLSDGLDPAYAGLFGNAQYNEDEEKWTADYTVNGSLCDQEEGALECPEICGYVFSCCFVWADDNPETIARSDSVSISVVGGKAPFAWGVAGTGFALSQGETSGGSNLLQADGAACGAATITVTDSCGALVTGYVRCSSGKWQATGDHLCPWWGEVAPVSSMRYNSPYWYSTTYYQKWKRREIYTHASFFDRPSDCGFYCEETYYDPCVSTYHLRGWDPCEPWECGGLWCCWRTYRFVETSEWVCP